MYGQACTYPGQARTLVKHVPWSSTYGTLVTHARHPGQACTYTGQARSLVKHVPWSSMYPGQACTLVKHVHWPSTYSGQAHTLVKYVHWPGRERKRETESIELYVRDKPYTTLDPMTCGSHQNTTTKGPINTATDTVQM